MATQTVQKYGVQGVYLYKRTARKVRYSFEKFKQMHAGKPIVGEREFWRLLETTEIKASYADDIHASLFDDDCPGWNFKNLGDIMDRNEPVFGVTDSMLYLGTPMSFFPWHCEDHFYYSVSYLHFGAPKIWYSIAQCDAEKFENLFKGAAECENIAMHKILLADPAFLRQIRVAVYETEQKPGEIIITFPRGYHSGINTGFNCAEATNFALFDWIPYGLNAPSCKHMEIFPINKDLYVQKYLPSNYLFSLIILIIYSTNDSCSLFQDRKFNAKW